LEQKVHKIREIGTTTGSSSSVVGIMMIMIHNHDQPSMDPVHPQQHGQQHQQQEIQERFMPLPLHMVSVTASTKATTTPNVTLSNDPKSK
jgi:hypothetical protein